MSIKRPYTLATVRVSAEEKEAVEQAAKSLGLSVADAIRSLPEVLEGRRVLQRFLEEKKP